MLSTTQTGLGVGWGIATGEQEVGLTLALMGNTVGVNQYREPTNPGANWTISTTTQVLFGHSG